MRTPVLAVAEDGQILFSWTVNTLADGTTDNYADIAAAITAAGQNARVLFPKPPSGGSYKSTQSLVPLDGS